LDDIIVEMLFSLFDETTTASSVGWASG